LFTQLPTATPVFVFADWQAELVARDAGFAAGMGAGAAPALDAPYELRLLHAWHVLLLDAPGASEAIDALGSDALVATGRMLIVRGRPADAERTLRRAIERAPGRADAWRHLGVALALEHRLDEARAAWQRSLELDPRQPEVTRWLADAANAASDAPAQNQKR
jgi:tetratricopeptide (TPR) repeat protein